MIFTNERSSLREKYFSAWQKYKKQQALDMLEEQIVAVILLHPEYHSMLENAERYQDKDYLPEFGETNPFLHMGLHLGIREQVGTNRPQGIQQVYIKLLHARGDEHAVEHAMIEQLVDMLWTAERNSHLPDEALYLRKLQAIE